MPEQEDRDKVAEAEELGPPEITDPTEDAEVEAHSMNAASPCTGDWFPI